MQIELNNLVAFKISLQEDILKIFAGKHFASRKEKDSILTI